MTFALDGEQAPYSVQLQLQGGGGYVQSPRITLDRAGWHETYLPFHKFDNILNTTDFDWSRVVRERLVIRYEGADNDPHTVYVGGWKRTPYSTVRLADPSTVATEKVSVPLGQEVVAEFVVGRDDGLLYGLAGVSERGTLLRSSKLSDLIHPVIYDRAGTRHEAFRWQGVTERSGEATVTVVSMDGQVTLRWVFTPAHERIDGQLFNGVGYRYEVTSTVPVDQIDEKTTWELGGTSVGNTAVLRSSAWATEVSGAADAAFNTYFSNPPRFAHAGAFEYQAGRLGQLLITFDRPAAIHAKFAKRPGEDVFEYLDTYSLRQERRTSTPTKLVLHAQGAVEPGVDLINAHTAVEDKVHNRLREMYGITQPQFVPSLTAPTFAGQRPLDELDRGWLHEAAELGFKLVHLGPIWNSDIENGGPSRATGIPVRTFDVAARYGGNAALRRLTERAGDEGLTINMWAPAAHMSRNASIVKQNPEWMAIGPFGAPASTYWSLAGFDLHDAAAREYLLTEISERRTADGLGGVWLDSTHAHGFSQYDHANPVVAPHVDAMIGHIRDLQSAGFAVYTEARSPFAVPSSGYIGNRQVYYQGHEYRAYETSMYVTGDVTLDEIDFYRFTANKALLFPVWNQGAVFWDRLESDPALRQQVRQANHDYNAVASNMDKRRLLHGDHGVEWTSDEVADLTTVLFSYDAFDYQLPNAGVRITDVTTGEAVTPDGRVLHTEGRHTYLIEQL